METTSDNGLKVVKFFCSLNTAATVWMIPFGLSGAVRCVVLIYESNEHFIVYALVSYVKLNFELQHSGLE